MALALLCWVVTGMTTGMARDGELTARFDSGVESVAFVLAGGKQAVTVAVAGSEAGEVRLQGAPSAYRPEVTVDPASRLILFRGEVSLGRGHSLAARAPHSGELRIGSEGETCRIDRRVKRIHGKYLPFTLLKLRYSGEVAPMGTPLFGADGKVAAVAHRPAGDATGFAVPVEVLSRFLESLRLAGKPQRIHLGLSLHPGSPTPRVTAVTPDSPAARAGFRSGDVVVEAAGQRIRDYGDAVNAFFLMLPEQTVSLTVNRSGKTLRLPVTPVAAP